MIRKRKPKKFLNLKLIERFLRDYQKMPYKDKSAVAGAVLVILILPISLMFFSKNNSPSTLEVAPLEIVEPCFITGCADHLCLDSKIDTPAATCPDIPTNSCLEKSRCERQPSSGRCGWTQTPEYLNCLSTLSR